MGKRKRKGWQTASEYLAELARDPEFQREHQKREDRRAGISAIFMEDERPIVRELREVGVAVESVWDLVNTTEPYPEAIPVLVKHLKRPHHPTTREGIARALTVKEATGLAEAVLIHEFRRAPTGTFNEEVTKWAIGNAISFIAEEEWKDDILALLGEKEHGGARSQLPRALAHFKDPHLDKVLIELAHDEDKGVVLQAIWALGRRKATQATSCLEDLLKHSDKDINRAAKSAMGKIRHYIEKQDGR